MAFFEDWNYVPITDKVARFQKGEVFGANPLL